MKVELVLSIENEPKTIPYRAEKKVDSVNHGFIPLISLRVGAHSRKATQLRSRSKSLIRSILRL
jgi:hypothetical protein